MQQRLLCYACCCKRRNLMNSKDISIQKYIAFITTVECSSFTRAAEKLHYSQSGISRMIGDLEKEWHVKLLIRDRNGVTLTSDGQLMLPYARDMVSSYERLQMQVDDISGLKSGIIRIGTFSSVATHWLPHIISRFQQDYPSIDYELRFGDYAEIEEWVREGRVDCGFTKLPAGVGLETIFLDEDPYMAVLPENDPLADADVFEVENFNGKPFLLLEQDHQEEVASYLERIGLSPDIRFSAWDDYAIMSMVECGLGISILPNLILKRIPYRIKVLPLSAPLTRRIGVILRSRSKASLAARTFLNYLQYR